MIPAWPRARGEPPVSALIRCHPEDFQVSEELGFEPAGEGEHVFLYLQKRNLNSLELLQRLSALSGVAERDIGLCGLKDRNALTRQWFSVGMAGRPEPDWRALETAGDVRVLERTRHLRKLRRGVHRANRFRLVLRELSGDRDALSRRLEAVGATGVPNYFGEQRFGNGGATLEQARAWVASGRRVTRTRRSLYFSALRAALFNNLLGQRVTAGTWDTIVDGDVCALRGSRSLFYCERADARTRERAAGGDVHPALPLWGSSRGAEFGAAVTHYREALAAERATCAFLERAGLALAWRPARLLADDFCWQFCDDGALQLDFALGAGGYATALLAELVRFRLPA